jgi:hypothetical protein
MQKQLNQHQLTNPHLYEWSAEILMQIPRDEANHIVDLLSPKDQLRIEKELVNLKNALFQEDQT